MLATIVEFGGCKLYQLPVGLLRGCALASQVSSAEGCIEAPATTNFSGPDSSFGIVGEKKLRLEVDVVSGSDVFWVWSVYCQRSTRSCMHTADESAKSHDLRHLCVPFGANCRRGLRMETRKKCFGC